MGKSKTRQAEKLDDVVRGMRGAMESALSEADRRTRPSRRGPLGMFGRPSRRDMLSDSLSGLRETGRGAMSAMLAMPSMPAMPSMTRRETGPDWSVVFSILAVAFAAVGAALLWIGDPRRAVASLPDSLKEYGARPREIYEKVVG
jgi:hypothetical protein